MSKRKLKQYLESLSKKELEEQVLELHDRLKEVKTFYSFVFNPKEEKMLDEAKFKVYKEYFPPGKRKPKKRRSVAQKIIKEFVKLGVRSELIADFMLYNIEIAQSYTAETEIKQEAFYQSMLKSFNEVNEFVHSNALTSEFSGRLNKIIDITFDQGWINKIAFEDLRK